MFSLPPALLGALLGVAGQIAHAAGKPALGAVLADPSLAGEVSAVVSDVVDVVTKVSPVVKKVVASAKGA